MSYILIDNDVKRAVRERREMLEKWVDFRRDRARSVKRGPWLRQGGFVLPGMLGSHGAPPGATDPNWANVASLLHFNGTNGATSTTDQKGITWTFAGAAVISNTQVYRGATSLYLNGSAYISTSNAAVVVGSGNFTTEVACYPTANSALGVLWSHRTTTAGYGGALLAADASGNMVLYVANAAGSNWQVIGTSAGFAWTLNTWQTLSISRVGSSIYTHKNGVYGATIAVTGAIANSGNFAIGVGSAAGSQSVTAYLDEFRHTVGVGRYTSSNYTPQVGEFPNS